jgi:hypothetical protein
MAYNHEAQIALNQKHLQDPQPGDYWEDHFVGILQFVAVSHGVVILFDQKVDVDRDHWQWDASKPKGLSLEEFRTHLCYKSEGMKHKTWADVHPKKGE